MFKATWYLGQTGVLEIFHMGGCKNDGPFLGYPKQ